MRRPAHWGPGAPQCRQTCPRPSRTRFEHPGTGFGSAFISVRERGAAEKEFTLVTFKSPPDITETQAKETGLKSSQSAQRHETTELYHLLRVTLFTRLSVMPPKRDH